VDGLSKQEGPRSKKVMTKPESLVEQEDNFDNIMAVNDVHHCNMVVWGVKKKCQKKKIGLIDEVITHEVEIDGEQQKWVF
jgi:hypothetical protein